MKFGVEFDQLILEDLHRSNNVLNLILRHEPIIGYAKLLLRVPLGDDDTGTRHEHAGELRVKGSGIAEVAEIGGGDRHRRRLI